MDTNNKKAADGTQPRPTGEQVDTWEMVVVHRMFRREFRAMPGLLRAVAAGDTTRSKLVGDHIATLAEALHHHHHGEDLLLWPKLVERVGSLNTELVQRMEAQHEVVSRGLSTVDELLPRWRGTADTSTRDELATVLADVSAALDEHLGEEEQEVLPLVSIYITQAEWDALGDHGKSGIPKGSKGFVALGMILEEATPDERVRFLGLLPPPVRVIYKVIGSGIHRRARAGLHG
jgi:hemerythrin-like domain-containing protein